MNRFTLGLICFLGLATQLPAQIITWISACTGQTFCINPGSCSQGNVFMTEQAVSNCFFGDDIDYSWKVDLNNNGGIEVQSPNDTCSGPFPVGTHRIYWRANDDCGNVANCSYLFTIKDCTPPSLLCLNGLTQNLQSPDCASTFTPEQFILTYSDNCTPNNQLEFGIRESGTGDGFPATTSVSFGSCDVGLNFVEIWVREPNGLMNICQNYVLVQQNGSPCECNPDGEITLHGCARSAGNKKLAEYRLRATVESLSGVQPAVNKTVAINTADSCFNITVAQLPFGGQYRATLRAERTNNAGEGVSTFDLVLMSKHILGIDPFPSAYQWLAADVNKSNSVTTFDIVETRKLLLGIYDTFPVSKSWRFIRPLVNPGDFSALTAIKDTYQITLNSLPDDISLYGHYFVGIKTGDANLSASFAGEAEERSGAPLLLLAEDRTLAAGESVTVPLRLSEAGALSGWQLALQTDPNLLRIETVENLAAENFSQTDDGLLRALWLDGAGKNFGVGETIFSLKITALQAVRLSDALQLAPGALAPEAYAGSSAAALLKRPLALRFAPAGAGGDAIVRVFAPHPNPCTGATRLGVQCAGEQPAVLSVFDAGGKMLWQAQLSLAEGFQEIALDGDNLPGGVLAWRLETAGQRFGGRLVRL